MVEVMLRVIEELKLENENLKLELEVEKGKNERLNEDIINLKSKVCDYEENIKMYKWQVRELKQFIDGRRIF